jgi:hypothetical protein
MNNDERAIDDGDGPDGLPEESLDTDHLLDAYDGSREDEELEVEDMGASSGPEPQEKTDEAISDEELEDTEIEASSDDELTAAVAEAAEGAAAEPASPAPVFNNFMDALYPKRAPAPCNARIIRRFDLEAAKYDPRPTPSPAPVVIPAPAVAVAQPAPEKKKEPLTREEARALRNRSLRAAAGLD